MKNPYWTYKSRPIPIFFDLVEDTVRSRCIWPLIALLIYLLLVFSLTSIDSTFDNTPEQIKLQLPLSTTYGFGKGFQHFYPNPRIKVTNKDGPAANVPISIVISDIITASSADYPNCDMESRENIAGSLEYIRLVTLCSISLDQPQVYTDNNGKVQIPNVTITKGPQAQYAIRFSSYFNKVVYLSDVSYTTLTTTVANLKILTPQPFSYDLTVDPMTSSFPNTIVVKVLDSLGNPVQGKYVTAYSWPEPQMNFMGSVYNIGAYKFAWLEGDTSTISDSQGLAYFYNLKLLGSTSKDIYIFFNCDGIVSRYWGTNLSPGQKTFQVSRYIPSIKLKTVVAKVTIVQDLPSTIVEGRPISVTPIVQVFDANNNPLQNRLVIAAITTENGNPLPYGYRRKIIGYDNKYLIKPIPGLYSQDYLNSVYGNDVIPILTDQNGLVKFNGMYFSTNGNIGKYKLTFYCDGVASAESAEIQVLTTITKIQWVTQPPASINNQKDPVETTLTPVIQVVDANGNGIMGKTPTINVILSDTNGNPIPNPTNSINIGLYLNTESSDFGPSGDSGLVTLYFTFSSFSQNLPAGTNIQLQASIDGITSTSNKFTISAGDELAGYCGGINLANTEVTQTISSGNSITLNYNVYDYQGNQADQTIVKLYTYYVTDGPTLLNPGIFSVTNTVNGLGLSSLSKSGEIQFTLDINGPKGVIWIRARAYCSLVDATIFNLTSALIKTQTAEDYLDNEYDFEINNARVQGFLSYVTSQDYAVIISPLATSVAKISTNYPLTSSSFNTNITMQTPLTVTLTLKDSQKNPIVNTAMSIQGNLLQVPTYLVYEPVNNYITFSQTSTTTDANGVVQMTITINNGNPGLYAINFACIGIYSDPILFQTNFPSNPILTIITQPAAQGVSGNGSIPIGNYLAPSQVSLKDSTGTPLPNYYIIASITRNDTARTNIVSMLDWSDTGDPSDDTLVINPGQNKSIRTDLNGIATFNTLTLMDSRGKQCVTFTFILGQYEMNITSSPSQQICFKNKVFMSISSTKYSKVLAKNFRFPSPIIVSVTRSDQWTVNDPFMITATVYNTDSVDIVNPAQTNSFFLSKQTCGYKNGVLLPTFGNSCNSKLSISINLGITTFTVKFNQLSWIYPVNDYAFQISVAGPSSYMIANFSTTNPLLRYPKAGYSSETTSLKVSNTPATISIAIQPPNTVYVGQYFNVQVKCTLSSGAPVSKVLVNVGIRYVKDTESLPSSSMQDMIVTMGTGDVDYGAMNKANSLVNALMDPTTTQLFTNKKGKANFNLKILSAMPGNYKLFFQIGKVKSPDTQIFQVLNTITSVTYTNTLSFDLSIEKLDNDYSLLPIQPQIKMDYSQGVIDISKKVYEVRLYAYTEIPASDQNSQSSSSSSSGSSIDAIINSVRNSNSSIVSNSMTLLLSLGQAIANGGKITRNTQEASEKVKISFSDPTTSIVYNSTTQINSIVAQFKDLSIKFTKYGKFQLVIIANGIESVLSDPFIIEPPVKTAAQKAWDIIQSILIPITGLVVVFANSAYMHVLWHPIAFGVAIITLYFVWYSEKSIVWISLNYAIIILMLLGLIEVIYQLFMRKFKNKSTMFFHMREEVFYEYTYQKLFGKPSENWKNRSKTRKDVDKSNEKIRNHPDSSRSSKYILMDNNAKDDSTPAIKNNGNSAIMSIELAKPGPIFSIEGSDTKPLNSNNNPSSSTENKEPELPPPPHEKLSTTEQFKRIFRPFVKSYTTDEIGDCFFYPQRYLSALALGFITVAYFVYQAVAKIFSLSASISNLSTKMDDSYLLGLYNCFSTIKSLGFKFQFQEATYQTSTQYLQWLEDNFDALAWALYIAFIVATILSILMFIMVIFIQLRNFKTKVLKLRRGEWFFEKQKITLVPATAYAGAQISLAAISYILVTILCTIVFTILFWKLFWITLYQILPALLLVIIPSLIKPIIMTIVKKILVTPNTIRHRRLYTILDMFFLFMSVLSGVVGAFSRLIVSMVFSFFGTIRIDEPLFPEWVLRLSYLDGVNKSFLAMVYMHHMYNHPIHITFAVILLRSIQQSTPGKKDKDSLKPSKNAKKLYLAYMLIKYPWLAKYRVKKPIKDESKIILDMSPEESNENEKPNDEVKMREIPDEFKVKEMNFRDNK